VVDRESGEPLYLQIAGQLDAAIHSGRLKSGTQMDNEVDLSERLGVSRPTLRRAIAELVARGLVVRRPGSGTIVMSRSSIERPMSIESLYDDLAAEGRRPSTTVLSLKKVPCPAEIITHLGRDPGPLLLVDRLRLADGEPLALLRNWLTGDASGISERALHRRGLYTILREQGIVPHLAEQVMASRAATETEAPLLEVPPGSPVLTANRTVFDGTGRFIERGTHVYRSDCYSFRMVLVSRPGAQQRRGRARGK